MHKVGRALPTLLGSFKTIPNLNVNSSQLLLIFARGFFLL